jgi:hypothetical protein
MRIGDGWEVRIEQRTVVTLYHDGQVIVDCDGRPYEYSSTEEARHVATHWDDYRAPTFAELRAMTDEELTAKAVRYTSH